MILLPFGIMAIALLFVTLGIRGTYQNVLGWKGPGREGKEPPP